MTPPKSSSLSSSQTTPGVTSSDYYERLCALSVIASPLPRCRIVSVPVGTEPVDSRSHRRHHGSGRLPLVPPVINTINAAAVASESQRSSASGSRGCSTTEIAERNDIPDVLVTAMSPSSTCGGSMLTTSSRRRRLYNIPRAGSGYDGDLEIRELSDDDGGGTTQEEVAFYSSKKGRSQKPPLSLVGPKMPKKRLVKLTGVSNPQLSTRGDLVAVGERITSRGCASSKTDDDEQADPDGPSTSCKNTFKRSRKPDSIQIAKSSKSEKGAPKNGDKNSTKSSDMENWKKIEPRREQNENLTETLRDTAKNTTERRIRESELEIASATVDCSFSKQKRLRPGRSKCAAPVQTSTENKHQRSFSNQESWNVESVNHDFFSTPADNTRTKSKARDT